LNNTKQKLQEHLVLPHTDDSSILKQPPKQSRSMLTGEMRKSVKNAKKKHSPANDSCAKNENFKFIHVSELLDNIKPTDWLIHGLLEVEALSVLFGESGSFKTFLALSWGLSISCGTDWFERKVKQGTVFFIIGEGKNGFAKRVRAWEIEMKEKLSDKPFYVSSAPVMMLDKESAKIAGDAINKLREKHGTPTLVVIDTLARNFGPGDENSTADMTMFISNLDKYIGRDCSRVVIHHTGHGNKNRARGSYALIAAADAEYCMTKKKNNVVLSCTKMKDDEKFTDIAFTPSIISIDNNSSRPMTSLVLDQIDMPETEIKRSPQMEQVLSLLNLMCKKNGRIRLSEWMHKCIEEKIYTKAGFYRAVASMTTKGFVKKTGNYIELSQQS